MTREEAKPYIGELKMYAKSRGWDEEYLIACDIAMNALEQEPILDKIRAELIQSIQNGTLKIESGNEELFRIINKYKAESKR